MYNKERRGPETNRTQGTDRVLEGSSVKPTEVSVGSHNLSSPLPPKLHGSRPQFTDETMNDLHTRQQETRSSKGRHLTNSDFVDVSRLHS